MEKIKIKNRVCSFGGVGSTAIIEHIEKNKNQIKEHEKRKHTINPKILENYSTKRAIFIFGNPYNSIISIFSRKIQRIHEISMNFGKKWWNEPNEMKITLTPETKLESYLESDLDVFNMEEHLDNWASYSGRIEIALIKYESLAKNINVVLEFLGCKEAMIVKERSSRWQDQNTTIQFGLKRLYGKLKQKVDDMPDIEFKTKKIMI